MYELIHLCWVAKKVFFYLFRYNKAYYSLYHLASVNESRKNEVGGVAIPRGAPWRAIVGPPALTTVRLPSIIPPMPSSILLCTNYQPNTINFLTISFLLYYINLCGQRGFYRCMQWTNIINS